MIIKDYTKEQLADIIDTIKCAVLNDNYIISLDGCKAENIQFLEEYNIREEKIVNILFNLEYEDFCYGLKNIRGGITLDDLYVFCPKRELHNAAGMVEFVDIYLKFDIIRDEKSNDVKKLLVSMHKRNKPITYIFKREKRRKEKL